MSDEDQLEANLRTFQRYATTWGAIVLIDEADVFLEARKAGGNDSARQNGLVASELFLLGENWASEYDMEN